MTVEYEIQADDVLRFWEFCERRDGVFRSTHRIAYAVGVTVAGVVVVAISRLPWVLYPMIAGGMLLIAFLAYPAVWPLEYRFQVRRALRRGHGNTALGKHKLLLLPDGVRETSEMSESFYNWSAVRSVAEAPEAVYLIVGPSTGYVVPRRAFATPTGVTEFVAKAEALRAGATNAATGERGGPTSGCS